MHPGNNIKKVFFTLLSFHIFAVFPAGILQPPIYDKGQPK